MQAFNFIENKAISISIPPEKLKVNTTLAWRNCQRLCLFRKKCHPVITTSIKNSTIEITGTQGIIGINTKTTRCSLSQLVLDDQGFLGFNLSLRD